MTEIPKTVPLPDGTVVPYHLSTALAYEHEFALYADLLWQKSSDLVSHVRKGRTLIGEKLTHITLKQPIIAWCLDTNATQLCLALIVVHATPSIPRTTVWMLDTYEFAEKIWKIQATSKLISRPRASDAA